MPAQDDQLLDFILFDEEVVAGNITKKGDAPAYPVNLNKVLDRTDYETYADLDFAALDLDGFTGGRIPSFVKAKEFNIAAILSGIASLTYQQTWTVTPSTYYRGIHITDDGATMYMATVSGRSIHQYTLSTPWDITTATYVTGIYLGNSPFYPYDVFINNDGTKMYVPFYSINAIYEYTLSTPWDVSSATETGSANVVGEPTCVKFKPDGTKMYLSSENNDEVFEYNLSTPWSISSMSLVTRTRDTISGLFDTIGAFYINSTGTDIYLLDASTNKLNKFTLTTPWDTDSLDISSRIETPTLYNDGHGNAQMYSLFISPDETKVYIGDIQNDKIHQHSMSLPLIEYNDITFPIQTGISQVYTNEFTVTSGITKTSGAKYSDPLALGKKYFEVTIEQRSNFSFVGGIADSVNPSAIGYDDTGMMFVYYDGNLIEATATISSGLGAYAVNDVLMIAYDTDARKAWFGKNGTWASNTGNPETGPGHTINGSAGSPFVYILGSGTSSGITATGTMSSHLYTPPAGFEAHLTPPLTLNGTPFDRTDIGAAYVAEKAFDGDYDTYYHSGEGSGEYVGYIFDTPQTPSKVRIHWTNGRTASWIPTNFSIQTSVDTTNGADGTWDTVASGLNINNITDWYDFDITASSCKGIRILQSGSLYLIVDEMEVY